MLLALLAFTGGPRAADGDVVYAIYRGDRLLFSFDADRPYGDFQVDGLPTIVFRYTAAGLDIVQNDCPDQFCLRQGPISRPGEQILCVPHKVLCRVESETGEIDIVLGG